MSKRLVCILLAVIMIAGIFPVAAFAVETTETPANGLPFGDVQNSDWFYDAVAYAFGTGLFNGVSEDRFNPRGGMTRAMFVTVLGRFAGVDVTEYDGAATGFTDIDEDAYYAPYVAWAVEKGITKGVGNGLFGVDGQVTREQMAVFFDNFFTAYDIPYPSGAGSDLSPNDIGSVSSWAADAVLKLYRAGVLRGDENGNFNPASPATRAEAATFFMNVDQNVGGRDSANPAAAAPGDSDGTEPSDTTEPPDTTEQPGGSGSTDPGATPSVPPPPAAGTYTVTFVTNGGGTVAPISVTKNGYMTALPEPEKEGYLFISWHTSPGFEDGTVFSLTDKVSGDLTLYAKYSEYINTSFNYTPDSYAYESTQQTDFSVVIINTGATLQASEIKSALTLEDYSNYGSSGLTVTDNGGGRFTVSANGGFTEGGNYGLRIRAGNDDLTFEGQEPTVRCVTFIIAKAEQLNLNLNTDKIKYIRADEISDIIVDSEPVTSLSVGLYNFGEKGSAGASLMGSFTYAGAGTLAIGDIICVYSGDVVPELNSELSFDDTAYITVTGINSTKVEFGEADPLEVFRLSNLLPFDETFITYTNNTKSDAVFTFTIPQNKVSFGDYAVLGIDASTEIRKGDYAAIFIKGNILLNSESDIVYGEITNVLLNAGVYTIACRAVTLNELKNANNVSIQNKALDFEDVLSQIQIDAIASDIERQVMDSTFMDRIAPSFLAMALETDDIKAIFGENTTPDKLNVLIPDGTAVSAADLIAGRTGISALSVNVGAKHIDELRFENVVSTQLDQNALRMTLGIRLEVVIQSENFDEISLYFTVKLVFDLGVSCSYDAFSLWDQWGPIWYLSDYQTNATVDVKTFTDFSIKCEFKTKTSHALTDITDKIKEIINGGKQKEEQKENVAKLYELYQDMIEEDLDFVSVFEKELFTKAGSFCAGTVQIKLTIKFVLNAAVNGAVQMDITYKTGTRYNFWLKLYEKSAGSNKSSLFNDEFGLDLYAVGQFGLRAGCEIEVATGIISVEYDSIGLIAQGGVQVKLYGIMQVTKGGSAAAKVVGATYITVGPYFESEFKAQVVNGKYTYSLPIYSYENVLYSVGSDSFIYDFAKRVDNDYLLIVNLTNNTIPGDIRKMSEIEFKTGDVNNVVYNTSSFDIKFTNSKFSLNGDKIVVPVGEEYLTTDMIITWKASPLVLTSNPVTQTIKVAFTDSANLKPKYLTEIKVNGSVVWSKFIEKDIIYRDALPTAEEILGLVNYTKFNREVSSSTVNIKYADGYTGYPTGLDAAVTGSKEFVFDLPIKNYEITVQDVQKDDGTKESRTYNAKYGESFNFTDLNATGTNIVNTTYTRYLRIDARGFDGAIAPTAITGDFAVQLLEDSATYHAVYVDDSYTVRFEFNVKNGSIAPVTAIQKIDNIIYDVFDYVVYLDALGYDVYTVSNYDISGYISSSVKITCVPKIGYTLAFVPGADKEFIDGYNPPANYNSFDGTELPGAAEFKDNMEWAFVGWYFNDEFTGNPITTIIGDLGNQTLYAKWEHPEYTIVFDANGGDGEQMPDIANAVVGTAVTLTANTYTIEPYIEFIQDDAIQPGFVEWNTEPDGSGIAYADGEEVELPLGISNGVLKLYAQWYDAYVSYEPNDSDAPVPSGKMSLYIALKYSADYPGTIKMLHDLTHTVFCEDYSYYYVYLNKTITLPDGTTFDGNKYKFDFNGTTKVSKIISIEEGSNVTLINCDINGVQPTYGAVYIVNNGNLTILDSHIKWLTNGGYEQTPGGLINHGTLVIKNSILGNPWTESQMLYNDGTMVLDGCEYYDASGMIMNEGLMILNNLYAHESYVYLAITNTGGELYVLNSVVPTFNLANSQGLSVEGGEVYVVNSICDLYIPENGGDVHVINSVYVIDDAKNGAESKLPVTYIDSTKYTSYADVFANTDKDGQGNYICGNVILTDECLRDNACWVYLDYSDPENINIGYDGGAGYVPLMGGVLDDTHKITNYQDGEIREVSDNRVGAKYVNIQ